MFSLFYLHKPKKITTFAVEFLKTYIAYGIKLTTFANKQNPFKSLSYEENSFFIAHVSNRS